MLDLLLINLSRCKKNILQILILKKSRPWPLNSAARTRTLGLIPDHTKIKKVAPATSSYLNRNTIYVADNVINMHEKYQLDPPYGF